jgi:hypothetical protein
MRCFCCDRDIGLARKARIRQFVDHDPEAGGPGSPAYRSSCENMTFRWAVVCPGCYALIDSDLGLAEIGGRLSNRPARPVPGRSP